MISTEMKQHKLGYEVNGKKVVKTIYATSFSKAVFKLRKVGIDGTITNERGF